MHAKLVAGTEDGKCHIYEIIKIENTQKKT
jgi:hypothetical protein